MRLIDADALKYKNLAEVNGRLTHVLTPEEINNAPTAAPEMSEKPQYVIKVNTSIDVQKFAEEWNRLTAHGVVLPEEHEIKRLDRPHGEWIVDKRTKEIVCSCCGQSRRDTRTNHIFFCNHCGAEMRKE